MNWPVEQTKQNQRVRLRRKALVAQLLDRFGQVFPEIAYELSWDSASVNAQAWRLGTNRYVRIYGGLARHPAITEYGLTLMLAHETGHHLGGPPYDPAMPWMSWQGQADYWAASVAMPKVWGIRAREATFKAAREIVRLHASLASQLEDDEPDVPADCRYQIFCSGALGEAMPTCGLEAFASISDDSDE